MKTDELHFLLSLLIGFVAFSLPLAMHDIGLLPALSSGASAGGEEQHPPAPPPYHDYQHYAEDDDTSKFSARGDGG